MSSSNTSSDINEVSSRLESVRIENDDDDVPRCPFHVQARLNARAPPSTPPVDPGLITRLAHNEGGSFVPSPTSEMLLDSIGGPSRLIEVFNVFYEKAFQDRVLDTFILSHDDPHGERLATWIVEKMTGSPVWSSRRPENARQRAHSQAWYSEKRDPSYQGRRFKLEDCRIWMRLMFWACRECGLFDPHYAAFMKWYKMFIAHFIAVYERSAPPYTKESAAWSSHPENIEGYLDDGRLMTDVLSPRTLELARSN